MKTVVDILRRGKLFLIVNADTGEEITLVRSKAHYRSQLLNALKRNHLLPSSQSLFTFSYLQKHFRMEG